MAACRTAHRGLYRLRWLHGGGEALSEMSREGRHRRGEEVRPSRPRRRRFPHRHEMVLLRGLTRPPQVPDLQRRRGRPGRVHGPLRPGGRPLPRHRGDDDRGLRHRRHQGYLYVRAEYPLAIERLQTALDVCYEKNYLGKNIQGWGFAFDPGSRKAPAPSSAARRPR